MHLLEGLPNRSRYKQVVGRGIRFCSHGCYLKKYNTECQQGLPVNKYWNVTIYKHFTRSPTGEAIWDEWADRDAYDKEKIVIQLMGVIAAAALDCKITSPRTGMPCGLKQLVQRLQQANCDTTKIVIKGHAYRDDTMVEGFIRKSMKTLFGIR